MGQWLRRCGAQPKDAGLTPAAVAALQTETKSDNACVKIPMWSKLHQIPPSTAGLVTRVYIRRVKPPKFEFKIILDEEEVQWY